MQIGISSASLYPQQPTEAAIVNIAALGCRTAEVFLQTRREYEPGYIKGLNRLCTELGMSIPSLHAASSQFEPMLFYSYRRQNLDGFDILNLVLEAGAALGARHLVFHGPLRVENPDRSRILQGLQAVAATAADWGIKLALENVSWCVGWSPAVFRWLGRQKIPNLYYTFDTKQALRSGFTPDEFLQSMAGRLCNVHISDGTGGLPTEDTNFAGLIHVLTALGYTGPVILEAYGGKVQNSAQLAKSWRLVKNKFTK